MRVRPTEASIHPNVTPGRTSSRAFQAFQHQTQVPISTEPVQDPYVQYLVDRANESVAAEAARPGSPPLILPPGPEVNDPYVEFIRDRAQQVATEQQIEDFYERQGEPAARIEAGEAAQEATGITGRGAGEAFAGNFGPDTGFGPAYPGAFPETDVAGMIAQHARDYYAQEFGDIDDDFDKQLGRLNEDYADDLGVLQGVMDGYKSGRISANDAYDEYQRVSESIMKAAITTPADPVQTTVEQTLRAEYDAAGDTLGSVAALIDGQGGMVEAMNEVTMYQDVMIDALRNDLLSAEEIHHATAKVAVALARQAYRDDQYGSEYAQAELTIQIQARIDQQAQEIAKMRNEWDKAKRRAEEDRADEKADVPAYEIEDDYFYQRSLRDWAGAMNLDEDQYDALTLKGQEAYEASGGSPTEYRKQINMTVNEYNMGTTGILDDWFKIMADISEINPMLGQDMADLGGTTDYLSNTTTYMRMAQTAMDQIEEYRAVNMAEVPRYDEFRSELIMAMGADRSDLDLWWDDDPFTLALKQYGAMRGDFDSQLREEHRKAEATQRAEYHSGAAHTGEPVPGYSYDG